MKSSPMRRWAPLTLVATLSLVILAGAELIAPAASVPSDLVQAIVAPRA